MLINKGNHRENSIIARTVIHVVICLLLIGFGNPCNSEPAKTEYRVLIFSGHVKDPASARDHKGAQSYTGIFEYEFNDAVVRHFLSDFYQVSGICYEVVLASENRGLQEWVNYAKRNAPDLYIEIHRDAARAEDIEKAGREGENSPLWDHMSGFSVHYSENNRFPERSKTFAQLFSFFYQNYFYHNWRAFSLARSLFFYSTKFLYSGGFFGVGLPPLEAFSTSFIRCTHNRIKRLRLQS